MEPVGSVNSRTAADLLKLEWRESAAIVLARGPYIVAGFPFMPPGTDFREGRREAFTDWLTAPGNPLFARLAVNRIWQWHFGQGLQRVPSDFGLLGGKPSNPKLLDYLASEFVAHQYSMKWLTRLIVTSDTYKMASKADAPLVAANETIDPSDTYLWRFRLQRLDAERR